MPSADEIIHLSDCVIIRDQIGVLQWNVILVFFNERERDFVQIILYLSEITRKAFNLHTKH